MLPLGTAAPDFELPAPDGTLHRLSDHEAAPALVVMFICNHCPYVTRINAELADIARDLMDEGVAVVAINSNDVENYPDDHPDLMAADSARLGYGFPYLFDEDQEVAKAYHAACTPDFYVFDGDRRLTYRGQLDDARPNNEEVVSGRDLRAAVDAVLADGEPLADQIPSLGCNIKWKPGNEPSYFG
jgi:peroxiredoxin